MTVEYFNKSVFYCRPFLFVYLSGLSEEGVLSVTAPHHGMCHEDSHRYEFSATWFPFTLLHLTVQD